MEDKAEYTTTSGPRDLPLVTPSEFVALIEGLIANHDGDWETVQGKADELKDRILRQLGYGEGLDKLEGLPSWRA